MREERSRSEIKQAIADWKDVDGVGMEPVTVSPGGWFQQIADEEVGPESRDRVVHA